MRVQITAFEEDAEEIEKLGKTVNRDTAEVIEVLVDGYLEQAIEDIRKGI